MGFVKHLSKILSSSFFFFQTYNTHISFNFFKLIFEKKSEMIKVKMITINIKKPLLIFLFRGLRLNRITTTVLHLLLRVHHCNTKKFIVVQRFIIFYRTRKN